MIKNSQNKMQKEDTVKDAGLQEFFFPDYQITIKASSREEAEIILKNNLKANE